MPFGAHVLSLLEDFLSEGMEFHAALDAFVLRSGVTLQALQQARAEANTRNEAGRKYAQAPKRYVAQALLNQLAAAGPAGDRMVANLITAVCNGAFPNLNNSAKAAVEALRTIREAERREVEETKRRLQEEAAAADADARRVREMLARQEQTARDGIRNAFTSMFGQSNPQARGYALEKVLSELFALEGLSPRGSFKLVGEQIDGSFSWRGGTHLVEAKWVSAPVSTADFASLQYKTTGKSADTRGLFVSINGFSPDSLENLRRKGELRFVCVDGAHLFRAMDAGSNLKFILDRVWRHADETGDPYLPVSLMK